VRYQTNEWAAVGILAAFSRRVGGFAICADATPTRLATVPGSSLIYPIPYYLAYPNAKYRHAIEPLLLLLGVYFASVLWASHGTLRTSAHFSIDYFKFH